MGNEEKSQNDFIAKLETKIQKTTRRALVNQQYKYKLLYESVGVCLDHGLKRCQWDTLQVSLSPRMFEKHIML